MSVTNIGGPKIVGTDNTNITSVGLNSQNPSATIQIQNDSTGTNAWYSEIAYDSAPHGWLSLSPTKGKIAQKQTKDITVKANPANLTHGTTYTAKVYLRWGSPPNPPIGELTVTFTPK